MNEGNGMGEEKVYNHHLFVFFAGDNGRIEFSITAGDDRNDFEITENGTIRTKRELDRETKTSYNLIVTAKDCAKEPTNKRLSSTVQVRILFFFFFSYSFRLLL